MKSLSELNTSVRDAVESRQEEKKYLQPAVKRYYVAGPMTNVWQCNTDAFDGAKALLESLGHQVITPVDLDREVGHDWTGCAGTVEELELKGFNRDEATLRNTQSIIGSDGIVMLPGWEKSKGTLQEKALAESLDKEVLELETMHPPKEPEEEPEEPELHWWTIADPADMNPKDAVGSRKAPMSVIPANVLVAVGNTMLEGALKYGRHNWRAKDIHAGVYYDAFMRHVMDWWEGSNADEKSGCHPLDHAIAGLIILRDAMQRDALIDDRPPKAIEGWLKLANMQAEEIVDKYPNPVVPHTEV